MSVLWRFSCKIQLLINHYVVTNLYLITGYLSPKGIQQCPDLQSVHHYTMEEIEAGENQDGTVYNKSMRISEETRDILVAGGDPHFIRRKGMECDIKWMLQTSKRPLYQLLDTTTCLRTDYRSLAEFLGIEGSTLEEIEMNHSYSCTEAIINHWTTRTGNKMTFALLYKVLIHPGLVSNREAANVIQIMMEKELLKVSLLGIIQTSIFFKCYVSLIYNSFIPGFIHNIFTISCRCHFRSAISEVLVRVSVLSKKPCDIHFKNSFTLFN